MRKKLSKEQINLIKELYKNKVENLTIAKILGIHPGSIRKILRKHGVKANKMNYYKGNLYLESRIVDMYANSKINTEKIAIYFKINPSTVIRILKKHNIILRDGTENKRRYIINDEFCKTISTESEAHFLGLMYADGNCSTLKNDVKILLHEQDIDILDKYSLLLYNKNLVKKYLRGNQYHVVLNITSKKFRDNMINLNCVPDKTFKIRLPNLNIVPENLMNHFIRGFLDGDGCISFTDVSRPRVIFTANKHFIQELNNYLANKNIIKNNKIRLHKRNNETASLEISGRSEVKNIIHYMYDNSSIYLQRKYNNSLKVLEFLKNKETKT